MIERKAVYRFLDSLETMAEGMRMMSAHSMDGRIMACGERLSAIVAEFRCEISDTKRDLRSVKIPGEDSYEVSCDE